MLPRQNVIKAKSYQGTMLPRQNVSRQNVTRQSVTRQNVTEPYFGTHDGMSAPVI